MMNGAVEFRRLALLTAYLDPSVPPVSVTTS
jgi:hypothetical protein